MKDQLYNIIEQKLGSVGQEGHLSDFVRLGLNESARPGVDVCMRINSLLEASLRN